MSFSFLFNIRYYYNYRSTYFKIMDSRTAHLSQPLSNASTNRYDPKRDGSHQNQTDGRRDDEEDRISHSYPMRPLKSTSPSLRPPDSKNGSKEKDSNAPVLPILSSSPKENFEPHNHNLSPSEKMGLDLDLYLSSAQKAEFDFIMARRQNFFESRKLRLNSAGSRSVGVDTSSSAGSRTNDYLFAGQRKIEDVSLECTRIFDKNNSTFALNLSPNKT